MPDPMYEKFSRRVNAASKASKPSTKIKILLDANQIYKKL